MKRICIVLLVCLLLLACQPTPTEDFVPQKDTVAMLEMAKTTPAPEEDVVGRVQTEGDRYTALPLPSLRERYQIPEAYRYHADLAEGHFVLNVDAKVLVPDVSTIPIVRVERSGFDPAFIRTLFQNLCGDAEFYYLDRTYTKTQIVERIKYLSENISDEQAYSREHGAESLADVKAEIERLKASYADAPDSVEPVRCYGEQQTVAHNYVTNGANGPVSHESTSLGIEAYTKAMDRWFVLLNTDPDSPLGSRKDAYLIYGKSKSRPDEIRCFPVPDTYQNDSYTPQQAKADVEAFLKQNGMDDFAVWSVLYAPDQVKEQPDDPMYWVKCVRTVNGVNTSFIRGQTWDSTDIWGPMWEYEMLLFWMDRDGIAGMDWHAPVKVCDTVVENANLLPFDKIMEIYLKMVNTKFAAAMNITEPDLKYGATTQNQYDIDRIELTLQRIQEPNEWDSALLVPVWNFYGVNTRTEVEDYIETTESTYPYEPMLSINAIDGTVIDVRKGY